MPASSRPVAGRWRHRASSPTRRRLEPEVAFDLAVDPETEAMLEQEALRQRTTLSQLAAHTVLVYLAELEFLGVAPRAEAAP